MLAAALLLLSAPTLLCAQSAIYASGNSNASSDQSESAGGYAGSAAQGNMNGQSAYLPSPTVQTYSPPVISSVPDAPIPESATTQVTTTPAAGSVPLFAKPGATPGQFELFKRPPPQEGEFEEFVAKTLNHRLPRFGSNLLMGGTKGFAAPPSTTVPPDYVLNPGDELLVRVTGDVEANLRLVIDNEGRVFVPKIGSINLAGVNYGDLAAAMSRRFTEQYKQVKLSVTIGHLHALTIYVTGYAVSPGAYTVSSLSTMVDAVLAAGGPSAGGSFRSMVLRRNGQVVSNLDLYSLLLRGDKTHDAILQNGDVLDIEPVGPEVAVTGSVNSEAIYEAMPTETLADVIGFAGGLNSLADDKRLVVVRLGDLDAAGSQQLSFAQARTFPAERGDIVRVLSLADIARPQERQAMLATIEGEVDHPGRYYLPPGSTLEDVLGKAGGLTSGAYVFGTNFSRDSIRSQQQISFDRAISDLELSAAAAPLSELSGLEAASAPARLQASLTVIDRLKERKPDGRLVLDIAYAATAFPMSLPLEDGDHIYIPPRPKTVGVFGAVYEPGSFLFTPAKRLSDYLKLAGGPQKIADRHEVFVVRANGAVLSSRQIHGFGDQPAYAGDVIFVPVRTGLTVWDKLRDIATIVFQFGVSAATIAILANQ